MSEIKYLTTEEQEMLKRANAATEGPWRRRRAALDPDCPDDQPVCYGIAAGTETWHGNRGCFHPKDAEYPVDEIEVVEIGYDGSTDLPIAPIKKEEDADFIAHSREDVPNLLQTISDLREREVEAGRLLQGFNPDFANALSFSTPIAEWLTDARAWLKGEAEEG